jgi:GTP-binding protein
VKRPRVEFLKSAIRAGQLPKDGRPEIAFVGRSNVGKSSLLNALCGKKGLAKTSGRPGKTQTLNFFDVAGRYYFVDLPGYGYAAVPVKVKEAWGRVMTAYLRDRVPLKLVVMLLDARHAPSEHDLEMLELLEDARRPTLIVATKIDKLKRSERAKNLARIRDACGLDAAAALVPFSAVTGEGRKELWEFIEDAAAGA